MINANFILSKLPPYTATKKTLVANQSISDIKKAILKAHELDKKQYSIIAPYFIGNTVEKTCENIFDFLRKNVNNVVENIENQSIKTPSAIVATGYTSGSDCKNYSLFTGGILDAINRSGLQKIPISYRFAKYQQSDSSYLNHVFIVVYPNTKKEIWVDCISDVPYFNHKKTPNFFKDYKINSMALNRISGISTPIQNVIYGLETERKKRLKNGTIKINSTADFRYLRAIENTKKMGGFDYNQVITKTLTDKSNSLTNTITPYPNVNNLLNNSNVAAAVNLLNNGFNVNNVLTTGLNFIPGVGPILSQLVGPISNLFGNKDDNARDYISYDDKDNRRGIALGSDAIFWAQQQPQDRNENLQLINVIGYLQDYGFRKYFVDNLNYNTFLEKMTRTGHGQEAANIINTVKLLRALNINKDVSPSELTNLLENLRVQQAQTGKNKPNLTANNGNDNVANSSKKINPLLLIGGAFLVAKITKII